MREELLERQRSTIDELDTTSHEMLSNAKELYTLAEARGNTTIKQEEETLYAFMPWTSGRERWKSWSRSCRKQSLMKE
jgi:hypothetical protein